jgi:hypothetical protein
VVKPPAVDESAWRGVWFGLRAGYAFPFGLAKSVGLGDVVSGSIPFGMEVGYAFSERLHVSAYFLYGLATSASGNNATCPNDPDISCSAYQLKFGAVADWHFNPRKGWDPWLGGGLGYDIVNLTAAASDGSLSQSGSLHGFELDLRAGADYKPAPSYGLGPFMDLSIGQYAYSTFNVHAWLMLGLRVRSRL